MIRFTMPDPTLPRPEIISNLKEQFNSFLESDTLNNLFSLLEVDAQDFVKNYNMRYEKNGKIVETQDIISDSSLEKYRDEIYPLLSELGCLHINRPLSNDFNHIILLGGSLNMCHSVTRSAKEWITDHTEFIDGLTCYRPINPIERKQADFSTNCDTEYGAMRDSFRDIFQISSTGNEIFQGDRNLNSISCINTLETKQKIKFRLFAAPSTEPEIRRADTGDSLAFYLNNSNLSSKDSLLFITYNRYCNRQFIQLAYQLLKCDMPLKMDIIGCTKDTDIVTSERFDATQFFQDIIGLIDWINKFNQEF